MGCICEIYIVVEITMHDRCLTLPSGRFVLYILAASHRQNTQSYTCFIRCNHIYKKKYILQWNTHWHQIGRAYIRRRKQINYAHRVRMKRRVNSLSLLSSFFPVFFFLRDCLFAYAYNNNNSKNKRIKKNIPKHTHTENEFAIHKIRSLLIFFVQLKWLLLLSCAFFSALFHPCFHAIFTFATIFCVSLNA